MGFASLRRLLAGKSRTPKTKKVGSQRRRITPILEHLESRIVPSNTYTVVAGDTGGLINAITSANTDTLNGITGDIIALTNGTYTFSSANNTTNGANVLPVITAKGLSIQGNGSILNAAAYGRLFDVSSAASVTLVKMSLTGGKVSGTTARGGAVYNSGALSMKSVIVGGNQAVGGSGQNAAGGGIYSNGSSLTLSHDVIGQTVDKTKTVTTNYKTSSRTTKHATSQIGASNKAASGSGGSAQGGGLFVAGGTVNVSNCTIAGNQDSGNVNAQGGGLYVAGGATVINLNNNIIGSEKYTTFSSSVNSTGATVVVTVTKTLGSANKAVGGSAMGGGLYVSGGTVSVSQGVIGGNQAVAGPGLNALGGGVYSANATLTFKTTAFPGNQAVGGAASAGLGNNGGNAQGGGLFISGGSVSLTNCHLAHVNANYASGGAIAGNGGAGGYGGSVQGGGIYVNNATLTLTGGLITGSLAAGNGGNGTTGTWIGGAGGNAQGGAIFATNSTVTASGTTIAGTARPGSGGNGANGTSKHGSGGSGGAAGIGQGGGIYIKGHSLTLTANAQQTPAAVQGLVGNVQVVNQQIVNELHGGMGGAGYNGTTGAGGAGGQGSKVEGGGVFATNATVTMEQGAVIENSNVQAALGGAGGKGKTGGVGGNGGVGLGGGIFIQGGSVSLTGTNTGIEVSNVNDPSLGGGGSGGTGGSGTLPGNGGQGGNAYGGGLYALSAGVTLNNGAILASDFAFSGKGGRGQNGINGSGGPGGNAANGGAAGAAFGGAVYLSGSGASLQVNTGLSNSTPVEFFANGVVGGEGGLGGVGGKGGTTGGAGGNGGSGGLAEGGALAVLGTGTTTINLNNAQIIDNAAQGGQGGLADHGGDGGRGSWAGGNGGVGGAAGAAMGGGVYVHASALTATNTAIENNSSVGGLGGLGAGGGFTFGLTAKQTKTAVGGGIAGNGNAGNVGGAAQGGGIYANASTVTLNTAIVDYNGSVGGNGGSGGDGGVTYIYRINLPGYDRKSSSGSIGGNGGAAQGGGVFATGSTTVNALNTDISGNGVTGGTGGAGGRGGYYASFLFNTGGNGGNAGAGGNGATGQGGGVYVNGSTFTLVNSTVAGNTLTGGNGGGGGNGGLGSSGQDYGGSGGAGGNGGNAAPVSGGGVFATTSTLKLVNDTVANNTLNAYGGSNGGAGGNGGNAGAAKGYPTKASHQGVGGNAGNGGNAATGQGGGLYMVSGSLNLLNDTFAYNAIHYNAVGAETPGAAGTPGKGIFNTTVTPAVRLTPDGQPGLAGTTTGVNQYGGLYVGSAVTTAAIENTIVALNNAATDTDLFGTFSSSDDDFIGDGTGSNLSNGVHGDIVGQYTTTQLTSFFGQLGNNFGPTQTIMPIETSPTIGKGDATAVTAIASAENISNSSNATDQRGLPRLSSTGLIDIGATELQVVFTGSPSVTTVQSGQSGQTITYTVHVTNGEGVPLNATLTDVIPGGATYVSNSAGGSVFSSGSQTNWTITQPSSTNSNTLTATATLAPGATATLTFTVTVASTASGTITDTANLNYTRPDNSSNSLSVPMSTTVTGGVATTTTKLTTSGNPSVFGQPVTFQAAVSSSGTPTGEVVFEDGNTILAKETLTSGVATFTTSALAVGSHSITAIYCGDANDYGSTSNTVTQVVNKDNTTTMLATSISPSVLGQNVTFKATVGISSPGAGTPTGSVAFYDGSTKLGTGTLSGGVATFSISSLSVGNHSITAAYSGDGNDLSSTSKAFTQEVHYNFGGFLPPLSNGLVYEVNRTIPIKFTLSDYNGNAITSLSAVTAVQIQQLDSNGNPVGSPFTPTSTNNLGLQYTGGHYQYNWKTKGLSAGSYEIEVVLADGTTQTKTITLTANGSSAGLTSGSGGSTTAGALLGGEVDLYVDNSNAELTSDELARIQDAVNNENSVIEPYGVTIVTVTDPTLANATISMNTTSSLGGYAQGILGCTVNASQVTLIQGWNWYAGSDPTLIGSGQYDFETAVMHELGHVLGLGHSSSSTSVMYGTLTTGTARRTLTDADLNVAGDGGTDALQAAAAAPVSATSNAPSLTAPGSPSTTGSGNSLSIVDQVLAEMALYLSEVRNAFQLEMSMLMAWQQQAEALQLQPFDVLLGFHAATTETPSGNSTRSLLGGR